jgi:hypothetical protein
MTSRADPRLVGLLLHADRHGPERPILLASRSAVRRKRGSAGPRRLSNPVGTLEVGQHEDVEERGARSGTEGV